MHNYVILTTHSSHLYSMWDFIHTCNSSISLSRVSLCLSVGFKTSLWAINKSYSLPMPNGLFTSSMHHPWGPCTPSMGITCQPRTHIHGNPACLCLWEPRTTSLFSTISNIPLLGFSFLSFFSGIFVCGPFRLSLSSLGKDHEHITTFAAHHHGL